MSVKIKHKAEVINILTLTDNVHQFRIRVKEVKHFDFTPGQFVTFDLPIGTKPAERLRSYSIASPPDGNNEFDLVIMNKEGGRASEYFFHVAHNGSELSMSSATGNFILPPVIDSDLCFVCTGTGIAPFRSMLLNLFKNKTTDKNIYLFFGTRYLNGVLFRSEMENLEKSFPQFTYRYILSKENAAGYAGPIGHVHELYENAFKEFKSINFYLCGWRDMIKEARMRIKKMGYADSCIHFELFG